MAQPVAESVGPVFPDWLVSVSRVPLDDGLWEGVAFGCCTTGSLLLVFWHENGFDTVGSTENLVVNLQRLLAYSGVPLRISEEKNARSRVG